jgi:RHS repeat-associated protein
MGAPTGQSNPVAQWGQQDVPTQATAVFPSDEIPNGSPPADYNYATVYYMDANGNEVNVAQPGGDITTAEYDQNGDVVRSLTAQNRTDALASSDSVSYALSHDTEYTYDSTGLELLRQLGPDHQVTLVDGTTTNARHDVQYSYDQGAPSGGPFYLVTTTAEGALVDGSTSDVDVRTTTTDYSGQNNLGWTLHQPTSTTVDPGSGHLSLTTTTKYDSLGRVTATIMPGNPAGGDAHETDTTYYRAGTGSGVAACDNHPEWDGRVCQSAPAAQPGTSGYPSLPVRSYTYDLWGNLATQTDTVGTTTRTGTNTYDGVGRLIHQAISGPGTSLPTADYAYSSTTGLPTTVSTTSPAQTITRAYDADGRLKTYTDADGNQTTYSYDTSDRPTSVNDGKGTETLTYNGGSERRGLLTGVTDSQAGSFTASYNADGALTTQGYPDGLLATTTTDASGQPVSLSYIKTTNCASACVWYADQASPSIHGQWLNHSSPLSSQSYTYDAAGRLTWTYDTVSGQCTTRQYGYDGDSNRTSLTTRAANSDGTCNTTSGGTAQSSAYDAADRVTTPGYTFDSMGRITTIPASDNGGLSATATYFVNDKVNTLTENGTTETMSLDPARRIRQVAASATKTYHYANDGDAPTWIAENSAGTTWSRNITGPAGLAAVGYQDNSVMLQLTNLHGDVIADAPASGTAQALSDTYEQTEFGMPRPGQGTPRYGWLGRYQRERDAATGLTLMGARVYSPFTGRFLTADPMPGGSANSYDYAGQDPINQNDLTGMFVWGGCYRTYLYQDYVWRVTKYHCWIAFDANETATIWWLI